MWRTLGQQSQQATSAPPLPKGLCGPGFGICFTLLTLALLTLGSTTAIQVEETMMRPASEFMTNSIGIKLRLVPAGTFIMGSEYGQPDERPSHQVTITGGFYLGVCEVTQEQYERIMERNPSYFKKGGNYPVERVAWNDAEEFCKRLSAREGRTYRLPTEAEWEYACRAGTTTRFSYGDDLNYTQLGLYSWYWENSYTLSKPSGRYLQWEDRYYTTHPVGQKKPNPWGLHDMHGNVLEWCQDRWADSLPGESVTDPQGPASGSRRVIRGGSWDSDAGYCRSASRLRGYPGVRYDDLGFRPVLAPGQPGE